MPETNNQPPGEEITLQKAIDMTTAFRTAYQQITTPTYANALPLAEAFNKSVFESLCSLPDYTAIRTYLGLDENNLVRLIFVAVDSQNQDILPGTSGGKIYEVGQRCPPICGAGPLNG